MQEEHTTVNIYHKHKNTKHKNIFWPRTIAKKRKTAEIQGMETTGTHRKAEYCNNTQNDYNIEDFTREQIKQVFEKFERR